MIGTECDRDQVREMIEQEISSKRDRDGLEIEAKSLRLEVST